MTQYKKTHVLFSNPGMIRDCWIETTDDTIIVIRQTKFDIDDLTKVETKTLRLRENEFMDIFEFLKEQK